jgi:hypothetical protein
VNPFEKYLGPEDKLQHAILNYANLQYPQAVIAHPTNEGKRSRFEQFKAKYLGISSGLPDLLIFNGSAYAHGLAIEVKAPGNKPTDRQRLWLEQLTACGWSAVWVNCFDDAKTAIDAHFRHITDTVYTQPG